MNDAGRREKLLRNLHAAEDAAQDFCTPIYAVDERGGPYLLGSGVLIDVADATYLATAAHVLDQNSDSNLYLPGNPLVALRGRAAKTRAPLGDRNEDSVDLGMVKLDKAIVASVVQVNRIGANDIDPSDSPRRFTGYGFAGYPSSQNKPRPGRKLRMSSSIVTVVPVEESRYAEVGAHPLIHFAGDFKRDAILDRSGKRVTAPDPHGMSGGGVWRLGRFQELEHRSVKPSLIGIGIEFHKENRLLLGIRASFLVASLAACFSETASALPKLPAHIRVNVTCS